VDGDVGPELVREPRLQLLHVVPLEQAPTWRAPMAPEAVAGATIGSLMIALEDGLMIQYLLDPEGAPGARELIGRVDLVWALFGIPAAES
jgi:hypothetical protein